MLSKEDIDMAETKKKDIEAVESNNRPEPVDELTRAKQELEYAYKRIQDLEEQDKQLISSAQKLYQENQTLKASVKAIASLL